MGLSQYEAYPDVDNLMAEIDTYDLHEHIVELEAYGMTVVPPERMQSSDGLRRAAARRHHPHMRETQRHGHRRPSHRQGGLA